MPKLLIATNNPGKLREYRGLLAGQRWELTWPKQEGMDLVVEETGSTYQENALLKAQAYAQASRLVALADDSGLEVEALGGEPGPYAARYAGVGASDQERIRYLLEKLAGVPLDQRRATFRCIIAVASPSGRVEYCQGECRGLIALEPRGEDGFGYDPIFYLPELAKTMAELFFEEKNRVSHRGQAARAALPLLSAWAAGD